MGPIHLIYVHVCTRYKVSVIKPAARRTVHRYKQCKKNSLHCISKHIVNGGKVQNVKIFKNYYFKNIVQSCIIFCMCIAPVQAHN